MWTRAIIWAGEYATVACDGQCNKAWGINGRPRLKLSEDPDDYAWLPDGELGEAPATSGIHEGGDWKPTNPGEVLNRWCARECERCVMTEPGRPRELPKLRDFSRLFYNRAPHTREA